MPKKRSRLALIGMLALALSVTVGLLVGPAEAAKKKSKKGGSFTVSRTAPTAIPNGGVVKVPIGSVGGKRLKQKIISFSTVEVTTSWSGAAGFGQGTFATLIAPNGRNTGLAAPASDPAVTASGPTTETPNSSTGFCVPNYAPTPPPPPPCSDPDNNVGPPYAGRVGNNGLATFGGISPRGTWIVKLFNFSGDVSTLNSISVTGRVINALP